jgi:hypothetical protein
MGQVLHGSAITTEAVLRPVARRLPLAIMGVRLHQSEGRARSTNSLPVLPELS